MATNTNDNANDRIFQEVLQATVELARRRIELRKLITEEIKEIDQNFIGELNRCNDLMEESWDRLHDCHLKVLEILIDEKSIEEEYIRYDDQKSMTNDIRRRLAAWMKNEEYTGNESSHSSQTIEYTKPHVSRILQERLDFEMAKRLDLEAEIKSLQAKKKEAEERACDYREALQESSFTRSPLAPTHDTRTHPNTRQESDNHQTQSADALQEILTNQMRCMERMLTSQHQNTMLLTLPKPEIQVFNGEPLDYYPFIRSFENLVEGKTDNYSTMLYYLVQYTTGEVQKLMKSCLSMEPKDGYLEARRLLKVRFGDDYTIATANVDKITKYQQLKSEDGKGLQQFSDELITCRNTLREIGYLSKIQNPDNLQTIISKLPFDIRKRWRMKADHITISEQREVTLYDITAYVEKEARIANHPVFGTVQTDKQQQKPRNDQSNSRYNKPHHKSTTKSSFSTQVDENSKWKSNCRFCKKDHFISDCKEFLDRNLDEKRKFVADNNLCFNCLCYGHRARFCRKNKNCEICKGRHSVLLHQPEEKPEVASRFVAAATSQTSKIGLPILPVKVKTRGGFTVISTYALLDCGSNGTFCTERLLKLLHITGTTTKLRLTTLDKDKSEVESSSVSLELQSIDGSSFTEICNVYSRPTLPFTSSDIPKQEDIDRWSYLDGIQIPSLNSGVDLIIGLDHRTILEPREVIQSRNNGPYAVRTILGWVINGPLGTKSNSREKTCNFIKSDVQLSKQFQQFCDMEFNDTIDETRLEMSQDDNKALEIYKGSTELLEGHYQVALPLKRDPLNLPDCRPMAEHRFSLLKKRFFKDPDLYLRYEDIVQDLLKNNYAEKVPYDEVQRTDGMVWYLPHHPVFHDKKPGKLRVVFDCSAKYQGTCLNDVLLKGPDMTSNLVGVLTRFRQGFYAMMGDIQSMFHQVNVIPTQRDLFRFLWWPKNDKNENPIDYRMKVHLFGATSSPSVCNYALRRTADDQIDNFSPDIINSVKKSFYVDDYLKSTDLESDAVRIIKDVTDLLSNGGFRLTKWISNSRNVITTVPQTERVSTLKNLNFDELPLERALGILWDTEVDCFTFQISIKDKPISRRGILSILSSVYDPLGFVAPVILTAKIILQDLTRLKLGWDDQVPEEYRSSWLRWLEQLPLLASLEVQRCFKPSDFGEIKSSQLHHFADSSEQAYSAATYLRLIDTNGKIYCSFVIGKSRVAPLKTLSIPRLELSAATVSIRLNNIVNRELELEVDDVYFWTDSTTVLKYINNNNKRFNTFVANRITTILDGSSRSQWKYVDTLQNVADTGTRTLLVKSFLKDARWLSGPEFLWQNEDKWPEQPEEFQLEENDPEVKASKISLLVVQEETSFIDNLVAKFSSWQKLKRCTAWILRFRQKLKDKVRKKNGLNPEVEFSQNLTLQEIKRAELEILRLVQQEIFPEEYKALKNKPTDGVNRKSSIYKLDPILVDDIIRVGGRLRRRNESFDIKHQIILPKKHHLTDLIIMHYHVSVAHSGREYCLSLIRRKYWPINGNSTVRKVLSQCKKCIKRTAPVCNQKMADLPEERLVDNLPPFSYIGIDCFGPFNVKRGRSIVKRYGCIFTCLSCRAVHLEVLCSMDTDSFLNSLRRFISRRGCPLRIRSDNGGNFVSGDREIRQSVQEWNRQQIDNFMIQREIEWSYNPPAGSHFGGVWERCIRSVRKILGFLLNEQTLCDESILTLFCEAEMIINGRPITTVSDDPKDFEALTPNHILLLRGGSQYPPGVFNERDCYVRRRWRHIQYLADVFWRRWTREYLPLLQTRQKWNNTKRNMKVGDVILFEDRDKPRGAWPLARISKVFEDDNGLVRVVELKTRTQTFKRPIDKLVLLESVDD